jgi:PAS domain S-box-containing protein
VVRGFSSLPASAEDLVGAERGREARVLAVAALVSGVAFWLVDAGVDFAITRDAPFLDAVFKPSAVEIWIRLLVAALLVALYAARRSRDRLRLFTSALAEAPDGVQIASLDGTIAYSNRAVQRIYGFAPEELHGKRVDEMNHDPGFASRVILPSLQQTGRWTGEVEVKHKNGHTFPIWLTTSVVLGSRRQPIAAVGIIRDLTERKAMEVSLRRYAERLEEATRVKDLFADILRHDLLGPASALNIALTLLDRHEPRSPAWERLLANARRSCAKLTAMIEDATRAAKQTPPHGIDLGELDLGDLLAGVVADFEVHLQHARAHVSFARSGRYPARAHPVIAEVFSNLLGNALKYGLSSDRRIDVAIDDQGDAWKVSVSDRGPGIADVDKPKVFTRFERLGNESVEGSGLGLAISKHIVDLHQGKIWVEDNPGGGSTFCLTVPKA